MYYGTNIEIIDKHRIARCEIKATLCDFYLHLVVKRYMTIQ